MNFLELSNITMNILSDFSSIVQRIDETSLYLFCGCFIGVGTVGLIVFMSGRGQKVFDNIHKIITGGAATTVMYKYATGGGGSGGDDDDKNNKNKNKSNDEKKSNDNNSSNDKSKSSDNSKSREKK